MRSPAPEREQINGTTGIADKRGRKGWVPAARSPTRERRHEINTPESRRLRVGTPYAKKKRSLEGAPKKPGG